VHQVARLVEHKLEVLVAEVTAASGAYWLTLFTERKDEWMIQHDKGTQPESAETTPTRFVHVREVRFAYRRFGNPVGTPLILLQERAAPALL